MREIAYVFKNKKGLYLKYIDFQNHKLLYSSDLKNAARYYCKKLFYNGENFPKYFHKNHKTCAVEIMVKLYE